MRGLAFPPNALADREPSYEYGTPISNVDDIPIDPALGGAPIDPVLMAEDLPTSAVPENPPVLVSPTRRVVHPHITHSTQPFLLPSKIEPQNHLPQHQPPLSDDYQIRQYLQGPQGDPFAPQIPTPFFPIEQTQQPTAPPKPKRKRKIYKEEECSFCQGSDAKNKRGEGEQLLTCHECGRSGHPSCMQLEKLGNVVRSYSWKCIECKNCEVCQEKGDDERILFCDWCDRGWHMDCMVPPLENPPEGEWHCPQCPPVISVEESQFPPREEGGQPTIPSAREPSVASTSRSVLDAQPTPTKPKRTRKISTRKKTKTAKAAASDGSDEEEEVQVQETTPTVYRGRGRPPKGTIRAKPRAPTLSSDEEIEVPSARPHRRKRPRESSPPAAPSSSRVVRLRIPPQRGKGKGREEDEPEHGLFDDILGIEERDTSKTTPMALDKAYFERSRIAAEEKTAPPPPLPTAGSSRMMDGDSASTPAHSRPLRSATLQHLPTPKLIDFANSPGPSTPGGGPSPLPKLEPGVLRIRSIRFGPYDIKTWYDAPFPEEYASIPDGRLWICEFCLKYMKGQSMAMRHQMKCKVRHPPGDEIYRDGTVSIFEVDGRRNKIYCQNLCLLSKMFLDHKSLFYDVEPFLFYVITQMDDLGGHFVGYFSKEKRCPKDYNLSCIMTLPVRQRQGWGNLLMDFSYLLSKVEQRLGSPEKPLSSLGALGYKNYWTLAINRFLEKASDNIRLEDISSATSMTIEDVYNTLIQLNMIVISESTAPPIRPSPGQSIKFPKGRKNGLPRKQLQRMQSSSMQDKDAADGRDNKGPFVPPKHYEIHFDRQKVEAYLRNWEAKGYLALKPEKLQWTPYIVARTEAAVAVDLPAVSGSSCKTPGESTKSKSALAPPAQTPSMSIEPATPAPVPAPAVAEVNGRAADSPVQQDGQPDDLSMNVDDDDDPGETRVRTRSGNRSPMKEQDTASSSSSSSRPPKIARAVSLPSSPPSQAPSRSLRTRSSHLNIPSPTRSAVGASTSTRATRMKGNNGKKTTNRDDEMLAARLVQEEQPTPTRALRTGRGDVQSENKRPAATMTPRAAVGRKRRRIESSPEVEDSPAPEEAVVVVVKEPLNSEGGEESDMAVDYDIPRAATTPPLPLKVNGTTQNGHAELVQEIPPLMTPPETATPVDGGTVSEESVARDVKSEDRGTPLTSLTSRQSLPSDDTVFMTDMHGGGGHKFGDYHGAVHAESDLRSTLGASELMNLDDCHDEDADGEYEEDGEDCCEYVPV